MVLPPETLRVRLQMTFALPDVNLNPGQYYLVQLGMCWNRRVPVSSRRRISPRQILLCRDSWEGGNSDGRSAYKHLRISPRRRAHLNNSITSGLGRDGAAGNGTVGNGEGGTSVNNGVDITNMDGGVRKVGGCQDTDNNNNEFDVVTPRYREIR